MRRREFITLVGGAMLPLAARAQQPGKLPTIGFLVSGTPASHGQWFAVLAQRLREFGWIEGRTIAIEYRFAQGREESFTEIFAEFVRHRVDIIVTSGAAILAAKQVASNIPIVFAAAIDPVSMGLVASLARPGGNITGLSLQGPDLAGKRLELLREVVPNLRRVAVLANTGTPGAVRGLDEARTSAHALGLEAAPLEIRRAEDIAPAIASVKGGADALYVCLLIVVNRIRITILTLTLRMPAIFASREHVEAGGLMSYGANFPDLYRRAAEHVDKILRGTRPGDIPVQQAMKFDFAVNLITANALGLEVPRSLLLCADEVIE
jgi:putative ABC transport system substrate-binding protein